MCCVVSRLGAALVYWPRWAPLSLHGSDRPMLSMKRRFGSAAGGSGDRCEGRRPVPDVVIAEARRLARKSPKTGQRRSLRTIAAELAALGHLALSEQPYHASGTCWRWRQLKSGALRSI